MPGAASAVSSPDILAYVLLDLAIILVAARVAGTALVRLGQPRIVGEMLAGVLIGPTLLGGRVATTVPGESPLPGTGLVGELYPLAAFAFLTLIGQLGVTLFMFLVGLELEARLLRGRGRQIAAISVAVVGVSVALGFLILPLLDGDTWRPAGVGATTFALFLGAAIAATALPVSARILQEKRLLGTELGAVGVGVAAVVTVLVFLIVGATEASSEGSALLGAVTVQVLLTAGLVAALALVVRPLLARALERLDHEAHIGTIVAVLLALALASGAAAEWIGVNALVGGFLAAVAVPAGPDLARAVTTRVQPVVVLFLLPVFLAVSGITTDFRILTWGLVPGALLLLGLTIAAKWGVTYAAGRAVGLGANEANAIGVLLNCGGLVVLVVGLAGLQLGAITPALQVVLVVGAIVTTLMTGPLVDRYVRRMRSDAAAPAPAGGVASIRV